MKKFKIGLQVHYIPIHLQPYYRKNFGYAIGDFPKAELFYEREVSLPIYPDLNKNDLEYVLDKLAEYVF